MLRLLLAFLLASSPAARAADATPATLSGDYYFYSPEQKDGRPVCSERWRFAADGALTIFSGQEVVTLRFRTEVTEGDHGSEHWLVRQALSTNGQPDCTGRNSSGVITGEERNYFYLASAGDLVLCAVQGTGSKRILAPIGLLYRAPGSDQPKPDVPH